MEPFRLYNEIDPEHCTAPAWAYGALIYQIFPDRFRNGNPGTDVRDDEYSYGTEYDEGPVRIRRETDWYAPVENPDVGRFYGGDLPGILEKLPYLKSLGTEAIYLNPIFVSPSNHRYDTADYEHVDPHLTTGDLATSNAYFSFFVEKCHEKGIRVILDGVFNHCSSRHPYFEHALSDPESPYRKWFSFDENGTPEYWWNVKTLPKFNYEEAPELEDYMMKIAAKWVSPPYNCDGWRLDVAPELGHSPEYNHRFWKRFRKTVKEANPEAVILAETYEDPSGWLKGDEWDSCMNYRGFMDPVSFYLTGMEKHSDRREEHLFRNTEEFLQAMSAAAAEFSGEDHAFCAMNQLDNHDHSRMITRTGFGIGRLGNASAEDASAGICMGLYRIAAVLQYTWAGCPTLYYGDETALPGWTDPDSRRPYPWNREDHRLIDFYSYLGRLHRSKAMKYGSLTVLPSEILLYLREYGEEKYLIAVNPGNEGKFLRTDLCALTGGRISGEHLSVSRVIGTTENVVSVGAKKPRTAANGFLFTMPACSAKVYRIKLGKELPDEFT